MTIEYKKVESLEKPLEVDMNLKPNWVYIRKNITEVAGTDNTKYTYDEALVTLEDYKITDSYTEYMQSMKTITKRQLLIWIYTNKKKTEDDIYTAIETITDTDKKYLAKINYSGTNNFYYGNGYVQLIGEALGLTIDEIKTMFDDACLL